MGSTTKQKARYKVGDYICNPESVFLEVMTVVDGVMPIYATRSPKAWNTLQWHTEYEFTDDKMVLGKPDFKTYDTLQAGDVLLAGTTANREYTTVLARVDNVILLSSIPDKKKAKLITDLSDQIKELTDGDIDPMRDALDDDDRSQIRKMGSGTHAARVAATWHTIDWLALMNWTLVRE